MDHKLVYEALKAALEALQTNKPQDRSDVDRRYAVTITDMEKIVPYFKTYVIDSIERQ